MGLQLDSAAVFNKLFLVEHLHAHPFSALASIAKPSRLLRYMTCYFLGGAGGSWLATTIYPRAGWYGVVIAGVCLGLLGIALGVAKWRWVVGERRP